MADTRKKSTAPPAKRASGAGKIWIVVALVALAAIAGVFAATRSPALPGSGDIGNSQLEALARQGARVIDVRTTQEFEAGHIPGAENVPVDQVASAMAGWDKSKPVVVYCATGSRSASAAQALMGAGFAHVYNLTAGIVAWDGETTAGAGEVAAASLAPLPSGLPALYEFYTDW